MSRIFISLLFCFAVVLDIIMASLFSFTGVFMAPAITIVSWIIFSGDQVDTAPLVFVSVIMLFVDQAYGHPFGFTMLSAAFAFIITKVLIQDRYLTNKDIKNRYTFVVFLVFTVVIQNAILAFLAL